MNGTIVRLVADKGYGFIKGEDGKDYFFHKMEFSGFFEDMVVDVQNGRKVLVKFESVHSDKGPRASDVIRTDGGI